MRRIYRRSLAVACLMFMGAFALPAPSAAMQILEAVDHAELAAEVSATDVNRIALVADRIARVVRAPDGYAVEHDAVSGDLWLRRVEGTPSTATPVTLFIGTERGFTYRLTLTPSDRAAAQILIRNADALPDMAAGASRSAVSASDPHIAALVKLVRAVARREPLAGYQILTGGSASVGGLTLIETWRGPRFRALVLEAGRSASPGGDGPAGLARTIGNSLAGGRVADGGRLAALWLAAPGTGPQGERLAVAVVETGGTETLR